MKKIVFVINDNLIGGAQRLFIELANRFAHDDAGYDVHLVTCFTFHGKQDLSNFIDPKVTVHEMSFSSVFDLKGWVRYYRFIKDIRPDCIFSTLFFANTVSRLASLLKGPKVIVVEQNTYDQKHPFFELIDRVLSRITPVIVCTSETVKSFTSAKERIPAEKFLVIHSGVDSEKLISSSRGNTKEKQREKLGISASAFVFLNTARLTPQKNHELLIEAFSEYAKEDSAAILLLVGDGGSAQSLKDLVSAKGLSDKVVFTGSIQDIWNYYLAADVFISTSRIEGFSLVHAEAMVFGLPIITTRTAGPDVMVIEGENGFFVESDTTSVVSAMRTMRNGDIRHYSSAAKVRSEQFTLSITYSKYKELLSSLVR